MKDLTEKTINSEAVYKGRVIDLYLEEVQLPNGKTAAREIVRHPGAVAVIAITRENRMVFVRQFRKPLDKTILEIPAGKLEKGEDPLACAKRELLEETGYQAAEMNFVHQFYTSPGFADELLYIYEGIHLTEGTAKPDEDEFVDLVELSLEEALQRIQTGEILDAKTLLAVYYWQTKSFTKEQP